MKTRQGLPAPRRPRTSHRPLRAVHFVLFLFACALLAGCASPGEPTERKPPVPQAVADLTAASLFYPVVRPPSFPYPSVQPPEHARAYLDPLAARPGGRWVARMYERHRTAPQ